MKLTENIDEELYEKVLEARAKLKQLSAQSTTFTPSTVAATYEPKDDTDGPESNYQNVGSIGLGYTDTLKAKDTTNKAESPGIIIN